MNYARRIVIDTGVLISAAIFPKSMPAHAFMYAQLNFDLCFNDETYFEIEKVLLRSKFDRYATKESRFVFLDKLKRISFFFSSPAIKIEDCPDPKDNKFLELAFDVDAEIILASDKHLNDLHPWRGIPILTPAIFLKGVQEIL